ARVGLLVLQDLDVQQVRSPVGDAGRLRKPGQKAVVARVELDVAAVAAAIRAAAVGVDWTWLSESLFGDICTGWTDGGEHCIEQRDLQALTVAVLVARDERHHDAGRC